MLFGAISAASSWSAPEKASNRPRTQVTGNVSHFVRNQPGGVRPSSASPPSPHSPCLTGVLTVQRLFGGGCVSEGWVKVPAGRTLDRKGRPMLIKLKGQVEAYYL